MTRTTGNLVGTIPLLRSEPGFKMPKGGHEV